VKYAYTVPLYHDKYKKAGVHPNDIKSIDDIKKLPFISKNDLREYFPDGIVPKGFDRENSFLMSTSGSTGKPVFVYCDLFSSIVRLEALVRELKAYGGSWRKSRIVLVIDLEPGSVENTVFAESAMPFLKKIGSLNNIKYLPIDGKPEVLLQEINEFAPEFLGSDPNMLRKLAFLKSKGQGKNIQPKYIISSGAMLDAYTKKHVEKSFNTRVLDVYGSTEAGSIAFECLQGNYHVHSDFVYLELLDKEKRPVGYNKPGKLVITKLYGGGTPIIRYTGNEDFLVPVEGSCSCGINTQIIKQIEGRSTDMIVLPDGEMMSPLTVTGIPSKIMEEFGTYKIKQFQIIQHKKDEIEILVIIDDKLRNVGPSVEKILKELKRRYQEKIGQNVKIFVNEIDEIQKDERADYIKVVVSKIKK
jgi:phenylacetate-CoA ligase